MRHCSTLTRIEISDNAFSGSIDFSELLNLQRIVIMRNDLSGNLDTLASLVNLQECTLSENRFSGDLEWLTSLVSLEVLTLDGNEFQGQVMN